MLYNTVSDPNRNRSKQLVM